MFSTYAKWPLEAFRFTGRVATSHGRSFCPNCGGRLFNLNEDNVEVRIGSLDDAPTELMPEQEGWTKRREHWLTPLVVRQFREDTDR
jgi:hypothetical protein